MEKQWAHDQTIHVRFSTSITLQKSHGTGLGLLREVAAMTQSPGTGREQHEMDLA